MRRQVLRGVTRIGVMVATALVGFAAAAQTPAPTQPAAPTGQPGRQGGPAQPGPGRGGARAGGAAGIQMTPGRGPAGPGYTEPLGKKHVLVLGGPAGFYHMSTPKAVGTIFELGESSGVYDADIRTDFSWVTKGQAPHNLDYYDAIVAVNVTGNWPLSDQQKKDFLAFIHDDGKGFVGIHGSLDANHGTAWPEYVDMIGGEFLFHPWWVSDAPVIVEDPTFPAVRHFPKSFVMTDEMYEPRMETFSRDKVNVLLRMDDTKLDYEGRMNVRPDHDFPLAWSKMYGKGRVFYSTIGHVAENFDNPDVRTMYLEAIKWVLRRTDGSTTPHPKVN